MNKNKKYISLIKTACFRTMPDKMFLKYIFYRKMGEKLDLKNPKTFNQKLQWLKINDRKSAYTKMVDKYKVREYISEKIGEEYLIPLIGVYNYFDEINFEDLPKQFVLKTTHDSGGVVICKDKNNFSIKDARNKINKSLKNNFYYHGREWPYKNVEPRIICEKYMVDESGVELKDYKIFCFNGEPKLIQVDYDRFINHKRNLYDLNWNYVEASIEFPTDSSVKIKKPENLEQMLDIARKLSENIPHLRVDLYSINGRIYFGELTFYHGSGFEKFEPQSFEEQFSSWLNISEFNIAK